ncbi:MAG: SwmB domain-containing protein, partial [Ilumatobacteraceae bacterium]
DSTANLSKSYLLTANINCNGVSITPMQNGFTYFSGVLDGGSKTISNVSLTCASAICGLFSRLAGATVKDLTLASFTVSSTYDNVGALAGYSSGTVTLTNLAVSGVNVSGANTVAGVISTCGVCIINDVHVSGSVTASGDYAAGIVANLGGNTAHASVVNDSSSSVTVSGGSFVGGLIGYEYRSSYDATVGVFNSNFTGSATSSGANKYGAGGIAGYTWNIAVADSWSSGSVTGVDDVGGITGNSRSSSRITRSWTSGSITSTTVSCSAGAGGIAGSTENSGSVSESYSVASITAVCRSGGVVGNGSASISNSFFRGSLTRSSGTDASFGGVTGRGNGSITNSYAATTNAYAYGSGLAGDIQYSPTCTSAYWDTSTSGRTTTYCAAGATGKTTSEMTTQATFSGWDFSTIWNIDPSKNSGYPFLRSVGGPASDGTAPTFSSAELMANGTKLVLTFNEALHATTAPASAFTVTASAVLITPSAAVVNGSTVELTLPSALESSASITVAYVAPAANSATSNAAVQDSAGNDAVSFSGRPVTNSSTADATAPTASWTAPSSPS